jgi:Zn-dependent protease
MPSGDDRPMMMALLILHWIYPIFLGMLVGLLAMTIHECGHLLAARVLGVRVKSVAFHWKGLCTVREAGPPMKNLLISIAGPLVNCALILTWHSSPIFGLANLCFAFINILPMEGSDGDRALKCWKRMNEVNNLTRNTI